MRSTERMEVIDLMAASLTWGVPGVVAGAPEMETQ